MRKDKRRIKIDLRDPAQVKLYEELKRAQEAFHVEAACLDAPLVAEANAKETIKQRTVRDKFAAIRRQQEEENRLRPPGQGWAAGTWAPRIARRRRPRRGRRVGQAEPEGVFLVQAEPELIRRQFVVGNGHDDPVQDVLVQEDPGDGRF